jgi:CheY-like chemotaxis protein
LSGKSVLVVEDDPDNAELLAFTLRTVGAEVRLAPDARVALDLLRSWQPDIFLFDISLPDMDGYALLETLRSELPLQDIPAIAVTAHAYDRDKQRAADAGFAAHVSKPYDLDAIVHLIASLLDGHAVTPASGRTSRVVDLSTEPTTRIRSTSGR